MVTGVVATGMTGVKINGRRAAPRGVPVYHKLRMEESDSSLRSCLVGALPWLPQATKH